MEYRLIHSIDEANPYLNMLREAKIVAVDVETTGLNPHRDKMRLVQLSTQGNPVLIFDCFTFLPYGKDMLKEILESASIKVFHNAKFDIQFLMGIGIEISHVFDTMLASQMLRSSGGPTRANLASVCSHYLGESVDKTEQLSNWGGELTSSQLLYAAKDAAVLLELRDKMLPLIYSNRLEKIASIEFNCVIAIAHMEYYGIHIDLKRWNELLIEVESEQRHALEMLYEYTGRPNYQLSLWGEEIAIDDTNFNSNPFVRRLLKKNGIDVSSTSKQYLSDYASHPLVKALTDYRRASKMLSTFLYPIPSEIDPITGRLHPKYGQIGAWSGRMSCGGPNIQQIPRDEAFRRCFCAPIGRKLVVADYSQIELRVAAQISGDKKMKEAYIRGEDLHTLTASLISEVSVEEVKKSQRQAAKAVNFGLIFGMGAAGLQSYSKQSYGVEMTMQQAEKFRSSFFKAYPGIANWHKRIKDFRPTEERTLSGRKFIFRKNSDFSGLYNTPVQGTAADIAKSALGIIIERIKGTDSKIIAIVHDEILLEVDEKNAAMYAVLLKDAMELAGNKILSEIPCIADAKIVDSWAGK